jgi:hypothetical protein
MAVGLRALHRRSGTAPRRIRCTTVFKPRSARQTVTPRSAKVAQHAMCGPTTVRIFVSAPTPEMNARSLDTLGGEPS